MHWKKRRPNIIGLRFFILHMLRSTAAAYFIYRGLFVDFAPRGYRILV